MIALAGSFAFSLSLLATRYPKVPRIALTATADAPTRKDIVNGLGLADGRTFIAGFNRPNIHYSIVVKDNGKQRTERVKLDEPKQVEAWLFNGEQMRKLPKWEKEPMERLAQDKQLMAYRHTSFWQCMDTLRDVRTLEDLWSTRRAPWRLWA